MTARAPWVNPRLTCPQTVAEVTNLLGADVYLVDAEVQALSRYASTCDGTIVEIGCAWGGSTSVLLSSAPPSARLHSIDPFVVDSMDTWAASEFACSRNVATFMARLGHIGDIDRWLLHVAPSYEAVKTWEQEIALMFLDGDHRYDAVRGDFEDWYPHLAPAGFLLIHDSQRIDGGPASEYNRGWQGPTQLATELLADPRVHLVEAVHSLTIWQKADS